MKRFLCLLLSVVLILGMIPSVIAETSDVSQPAEEKTLKIVGVNVSLQYLNSKGKGGGTYLKEIDFTNDYINQLTGEVCKGGSLDVCVTSGLKKNAGSKTWVINGHRYVFSAAVKSIIIKGLTESMTIEIVANKAEPETAVMGDEAIETCGEGPLVVDVDKAQLCFMDEKGKQKGGWFTEFDFTNDYVQPATQQTMLGGSATVFVKAKTSGNKGVKCWLFDKTEMYFSPKVSSFTVKDLNVKKHYEPVLQAVKAKATAKPQAQGPSQPSETYYTVKCTGCTFSGGGNSRASSGKVKAGTKITVTTSYLYSECFYVNGSRCHNRVNSFSMTVNSNTTIVSEQQIN